MGDMETRTSDPTPCRSCRPPARWVDFADPALWAWVAVAVMLVVPALSVLA